MSLFSLPAACPPRSTCWQVFPHSPRRVRMPDPSFVLPSSRAGGYYLVRRHSEMPSIIMSTVLSSVAPMELGQVRAVLARGTGD
jgi:hypothetical protein